jgi:hypothetical protein
MTAKPIDNSDDAPGVVTEANPRNQNLIDLSKRCSAMTGYDLALNGEISEALGVRYIPFTNSLDACMRYIGQHYPANEWRFQIVIGKEFTYAVLEKYSPQGQSPFDVRTNPHYQRPALTAEGAVTSLICYAESFRK